MLVTPVTLAGTTVRLEPLRIEHVPALCAAGLHPELWRWIPIRVRTEGDMRQYVEAALADGAAGRALPFATLDAGTGEVIGSTRYGAIEPAHGRLEIGWTWLTPGRLRTRANTEAKFLMLRHAFETLGCGRIELKTDALNERSRAAIARLGATPEGIFRRHLVCDDGRVRDTAWFSVIADEWPRVKASLEARLAPRQPACAPAIS